VVKGLSLLLSVREIAGVEFFPANFGTVKGVEVKILEFRNYLTFSQINYS